MIAEQTGKASWRVALENAVVIFGTSFFTILAASGFNDLPTLQQTWAAIGVSALTGIVSYARSRGINSVG